MIINFFKPWDINTLTTIIGIPALLWVVLSIIKEVNRHYKSFVLWSFWRQKSNCIKCLSFWTLLGITFDPFAAATGSLIIYSLTKTDTIGI